MTALRRWAIDLLPANPIVVQIVEGGSRRYRHLWVRMGYLGALIALMLIGLLAAGGLTRSNLAELAKAGTQIFFVVSYGQVVLICLLAPVFMAGAIAQEQSGQTYDILLTTPLANLQIVLGMLLGRLFFVLTLLASGVPLFAVLLVFGGVPIEAVFVAFAVAALTALVVGAVAVALSVSRRGGRKAVYLFVTGVVAYLVASYAVDQFLRQAQSGPGVVGLVRETTVLTPLHPLLVLESYTQTSTYRPPSPQSLADRSALVRFYRGQPLAAFTAWTLGLSLGLMLWSATLVRRIGTGDARSWRRALLSWLRLDALWRGSGRRKPRAVWANPIAWREAHTRANRGVALLGRSAFVVLSVALAAWILGQYHFRSPLLLGQRPAGAGELRAWIAALIWLQLTVIVLVAVYMSASSVSREREDGTLDLLLTTPVTARQYIWGKVRGLVSFLALLLAAPLLTLGLVCGYTAVGLVLGWPQAQAGFSLQGGTGSITWMLVPPEAAVLLAIQVVPFVALCVAVGMWWSLKARSVLGAVTPTVAIVGILGLFLGFCGYPMAENVPLLGPLVNAASPATAIVMLLNPCERVAMFADNTILGRVTLALGALAAGGAYALIVYSLVSGMVRSFDQTVRRLAGAST